MLKIIQILTLLQGLLLLTILITKKNEFKRVNFWLLIACIVSVMLFAIGDDTHNLFVEKSNWYAFYDILIVTNFFLLIKYHNSNKTKFDKKDLLYFIPYILFVSGQFIEHNLGFHDNLIVLLVTIIVAIVVLGYLVLMIIKLFVAKEERWMLFFVLPYTLIFVIERIVDMVTVNHDSIPFFESYGIIGLSAFILYILLFKLVISPKQVIPHSNNSKYKTSGLRQTEVENYTKQLIHLFEKEKVFKNGKITVNEVAQKLNIPRQYLSEILNVHLKSNFQDFLNKYRVEEFILCLSNEEYKNYSMLGIAKEAGFNSKTAFYTSFKKMKGMTPSEFKKQMSN